MSSALRKLLLGSLFDSEPSAVCKEEAFSLSLWT